MLVKFDISSLTSKKLSTCSASYSGLLLSHFLNDIIKVADNDLHLSHKALYVLKEFCNTDVAIDAKLAM